MIEKSVARRRHQGRQVVLGLSVIAGLIQQVYAQEAPAATAEPSAAEHDAGRVAECSWCRDRVPRRPTCTP